MKTSLAYGFKSETQHTVFLLNKQIVLVEKAAMVTLLDGCRNDLLVYNKADVNDNQLPR